MNFGAIGSVLVVSGLIPAIIAVLKVAPARRVNTFLMWWLFGVVFPVIAIVFALLKDSEVSGPTRKERAQADALRAEKANQCRVCGEPRKNPDAACEGCGAPSL